MASRERRIFVTFHQIRALQSVRNSAGLGVQMNIHQRRRRVDLHFPAISDDTIARATISTPSTVHITRNHYYHLMRELRQSGFIAEASVIPHPVQQPDTTNPEDRNSASPSSNDTSSSESHSSHDPCHDADTSSSSSTSDSTSRSSRSNSSDVDDDASQLDMSRFLFFFLFHSFLALFH
jgi:hypothetical protein